MPDAPPRRRPRLSLRAALLLVLVVGLPLGWKARRASIQRRAVVAVRAVGGKVSYLDELDARGFPRRPHRPGGPAWLRRWVGDEFFQEVGYVNFDTRAPGGRVDDDSIGVLGAFEHLQGLTIWGQGTNDETPARVRLTAAGLGRLIGLRRLRILHLLGVPVDAAMVAVLPGLPALEDVEFRDPARSSGALPGACLADLARIPGLRKVTIIPLTPCRAADVAPLGRLEHLDELWLSPSPRDDAGLGPLVARPSLRVLRLPQTEFTPATLAAVGRNANLQGLTFDGSKLTQGDLKHLAGLAGLVELDVMLDGRSGRPNAHHLVDRVAGRFGDADLDALAAAPLKGLTLMGLDATDAGVGRLLQGHSFVNLTLRGRGITDASIAPLVGQVGLSSLTLADTGITDAGLGRLKALGGLKALSLVDNAGLTDAGVAGLAAFPKLDYLTIRQPGVRPATLDAIRAARVRFNIFQALDEVAR